MATEHYTEIVDFSHKTLALFKFIVLSKHYEGEITMKQTQRVTAAKKTLEIIERGGYANPAGQDVPLRAAIERCVGGSKLYLPEELDVLRDAVLAQSKPYATTRFELRNETTLEGALRVVRSGEFSNVAALNFASARNPGGGFLGGAQAQEESIARSSALYASLRACFAFYEYHRGMQSLLYTDRMIYTPQCPVFRTDNGALLNEPYCLSIITSPAPNAGALQRNQPQDVAKIPGVFRERTAKLLALAVEQHCDALLLGAWGCGVFKNSPAVVASTFRELLAPGGAFHGRFSFVLFSVYDTTEGLPIYTEFAKQLEEFC